VGVLRARADGVVVGGYFLDSVEHVGELCVEIHSLRAVSEPIKSLVQAPHLVV